MNHARRLISRIVCCAPIIVILLAACGGGGGGGTPEVAPPTLPVPNAVQPAWASMAVMVAPDQSSKVIPLSGCSASGSVAVPVLYDARLTIQANGNASFSASALPAGPATITYSIAQDEVTYRQNQFSIVGTPRLEYYYITDRNGTSRSMRLQTTSGQSFDYNATDSIALGQSIACTTGATVEALTPSPSFLPSQARVAAKFLLGVTSAGGNPAIPDADARLINGAFHWVTDWEAASSTNPRPGTALSLSNAQLLNGHYIGAAGLAPSPAPISVDFASATLTGQYTEAYKEGSNTVDGGLRIQVELRTPGSQSNATNYELSRVGNELRVGNVLPQ